MIRLVITGIFLILFFLVSLPIFLVELILDKTNKRAADYSSLRIVQWALRVVIVLSGVKLTELGRENIPTDRPVLFIGNHLGIFDIVVTLAYMPNPTGYISKEANFKIPIFRYWMKRLYCLPIDRESGKKSLKCILQCIEFVKQGVSIMVFPEAQRNLTFENGLLPFHEGSFRISTKTGAPIVPVAILNTEYIYEKHKPWLKATHVVVEYGKPIDPNDFTKEEQKTIGAYTQHVIEGMLEKNKELL